VLSPGLARAAAPTVFAPAANLTFGDLVTAVSQAPEMKAATRELKVREAAQAQSRLWPNPVLDATWATIPIGRTNPEGLGEPMTRIPSYHVGLSYTVPLGKRGPMQAMRAAEVRATWSQQCATGRRLALELAEALGNMAAAELRIDALRQQVQAAEEQERQVAARLSQQLASGLELDRAAIERGRFEQQVFAAESALNEQRAVCSATTGLTCIPFANAAEAKEYLEKWVNVAVDDLIEHMSRIERPEMASLASAEAASRHAETYYSRQKIPDPTIRVGYVHDQFWVSGAQPNSLELTVSLPLPAFDYGQAGSRSARYSAEGYQAERASMRRVTEAVVPALKERLQSQRARRKNLVEVLIPRARAVVSDVLRSYDTRLLSMNDVIQARRALLDLLLGEVDGLADAYSAVLGLRAQIAVSEDEGCTR
jgi:cobalt-zinc-cadmium efflux system outer membrane protein